MEDARAEMLSTYPQESDDAEELFLFFDGIFGSIMEPNRSK